MWFKPKLKVAVHSGAFHADDVFAVALLKIIFDEEIFVIRTRDESIIAKADFVVDVGGIYDPEKNRFDHHQSGGAGGRPNGIPYASFGLAWKKFADKATGSKEVSDRIDERLVQPIDAIDNGIAIYEELFAGVRPYDISSVIGTMNPNWNEGTESADDMFFVAVELARNILEREIKITKDNLEGEQIARATYIAAPDKRLITLDKDCPWQRVYSKFPEPLYVVYPKGEEWRVKAVRSDLNSFANRKDLPKAWGGKRNADLAAVTGVPDSIFCHNKLFSAIAKSKEGALALAKLALES